MGLSSADPCSRPSTDCLCWVLRLLAEEAEQARGVSSLGCIGPC